jgi:hypothetical protein
MWQETRVEVCPDAGPAMSFGVPRRPFQRLGCPTISHFTIFIAERTDWVKHRRKVPAIGRMSAQYISSGMQWFPIWTNRIW